MSGTSPRDAEDLMARCLELLENGETAELERLLRAHPDLDSELRGGLRLLIEAGLAGPVGSLLDEGDRIDGFRLVRRLGSGGMGIVFEAHDETLDREVALKVMRPELGLRADARARFRREALAAGALKHPGIVPVYSVGDERDTPYIVMELVPGAALDTILEDVAARAPEELDGIRVVEAIERRGHEASWEPLASWNDVGCHLAVQAAESLAHAHTHGILHRDVKPSNLMVTPDGTVRLLDFGLARAADDMEVSHSRAVIGSYPYMAPEQIEGGGEVDERTDVYGLGVTLYETLTLRSPFTSASPEATRRLVLAASPPAIRALNPRVSRDVELVCQKAMDPDPQHRYPTMRAFADDLQRCLDRRPVTARPAGVMLRTRRWSQRHPARATAALLAFALLVVAPIVATFVQTRHAHELADVNRRLEDQSRDLAASLQWSEAARRRTENIAIFLERILQGGDPDGLESIADLPLSETLAWGTRLIDSQFQHDPAGKAKVHLILGAAQSRLGNLGQAEAQLEAARGLAKLTRGPDREELVRLMLALARLRIRHRERPALDALYEETESLLSDGPEHDKLRFDLATVQCDAAISEEDVARADEALGRLAAIRHDLPADPLRDAKLDIRRAFVHTLHGREEAAREATRVALETLDGLDAQEAPRAFGILIHVATLIVQSSEPEPAGAILDRAWRALQLGTGSKSIAAANCAYLRGCLELRRARLEVAERHFKESLDLFQRNCPNEGQLSSVCRMRLGRLQLVRGAITEGARNIEVAAQTIERLGAHTTRIGIQTLCAAAMAAAMQRNTERVATLSALAEKHARARYTDRPRQLAEALIDLARAASLSRQTELASRLAAEILRVLPADVEPMRRLPAKTILAEVTTAPDALREAVISLEATLDEMPASASDPTHRAHGWRVLGDGWLNLAEYEDARDSFEEARAIFDRTGLRGLDWVRLNSSIARLHLMDRRYQDAEKTSHRARQALLSLPHPDRGLETLLIATRVRALSFLGRPEEAFQLTTRPAGELDDVDPASRANLFLARGISAELAGRHEAACDAFIRSWSECAAAHGLEAPSTRQLAAQLPSRIARAENGVRSLESEIERVSKAAADDPRLPTLRGLLKEEGPPR